MWAQGLWHMGLVVQQHVEFSQTRDQTCVPCIGSQILNPWTTMEVPEVTFVVYDFLSSQSSPWVCKLHNDRCISVHSALSRTPGKQVFCLYLLHVELVHRWGN